MNLLPLKACQLFTSPPRLLNKAEFNLVDTKKNEMLKIFAERK
jgi:hypothetical protein